MRPALNNASPEKDSSQAAADALNEALAAELRGIQAIANITVRAWVKDIPVVADSVYRVLRSQRPVSTVELVQLCRAIQEDPLDLIARAERRAELRSPSDRR
jgi:hypothetical protein